MLTILTPTEAGETGPVQTTDLVSVRETSSDLTNTEQRKEVEGRTWAGVCRSCRTQEVCQLRVLLHNK